MKRQHAITAVLAILAMTALGSSAALAAPGDALAVVTVPVLSPTGIGVSIAADCEYNLYYTNYQSPFLHKMTAAGALLGTVPLADATGAPITIGEMAWDRKRNVLWGGTDSVSPIKIYQINPLTGLCTYQFDGGPGIDLTDGLAYEEGITGDPLEDKIYHSPDVSCDIYVFQAMTGALLGTVTPKDAGGAALCYISGTYIGLGNTLYVGRDGFGQIHRVDKVTGDWIGSFATPGGRDEGLECDVWNFAPKYVLWSKDAYNDQVTAIEVEPRTCACSGVVPTLPKTWGGLKGTYR